MQTTLEKSDQFGWNAKTEIRLPDSLDTKDGKAFLIIKTIKVFSKYYSSSASIEWKHLTGSVSTIGGGDFYKSLCRAHSDITRGTEKAVKLAHDLILKQFPDLAQECIQHQNNKGQ